MIYAGRNGASRHKVHILKKLKYTFDTEIQFSEPVYEHTFVLRCQPHKRPGIRVLESNLIVEPDMRYMRQIDSFGNQLAIGREPNPHTHMRYCSSGTVEIDFSRTLAAGAEAAGTAATATPGSWDAAHAVYRYPSELTRENDALSAFIHENGAEVAALAANQQNETLVDAIARLSSTVYEYMDYAPGTTHVRTSAAEAFAARAGVCQDFSHVLICALRSCGVPARYVSGLALGEGQTHAWVEAFVNGGWTGFDPTRNQRVDETYLPLAVGRDWIDCPIEQGSFFGFANQTQTVYMTVTEI